MSVFYRLLEKISLKEAEIGARNELKKCIKNFTHYFCAGIDV
jgi:hypothetical protein